MPSPDKHLISTLTSQCLRNVFQSWKPAMAWTWVLRFIILNLTNPIPSAIPVITHNTTSPPPRKLLGSLENCWNVIYTNPIIPILSVWWVFFWLVVLFYRKKNCVFFLFYIYNLIGKWSYVNHSRLTLFCRQYFSSS